MPPVGWLPTNRPGQLIWELEMLMVLGKTRPRETTALLEVGVVP